MSLIRKITIILFVLFGFVGNAFSADMQSRDLLKYQKHISSLECSYGFLKKKKCKIISSESNSRDFVKNFFNQKSKGLVYSKKKILDKRAEKVLKYISMLELKKFIKSVYRKGMANSFSDYSDDCIWESSVFMPNAAYLEEHPTIEKDSPKQLKTLRVDKEKMKELVEKYQNRDRMYTFDVDYMDVSEGYKILSKNEKIKYSKDLTQLIYIKKTKQDRSKAGLEAISVKKVTFERDENFDIKIKSVKTKLEPYSKPQKKVEKVLTLKDVDVTKLKKDKKWADRYDERKRELIEENKKENNIILLVYTADRIEQISDDIQTGSKKSSELIKEGRSFIEKSLKYYNKVSREEDKKAKDATSKYKKAVNKFKSLGY